MTDDERRIFEGRERRKAEKEDPCDSCEGTGRDDNAICGHRLGQKVLLTAAEYEFLMTVANRADDRILDQKVLGRD